MTIQNKNKTFSQMVVFLSVLLLSGAAYAQQRDPAPEKPNSEQNSKQRGAHVPSQNKNATVVQVDNGKEENNAANNKPMEPELIPPKLKAHVDAAYPEAAKKQGVSAEVLLEIDIDASGQVEGVTVVQSAVPADLGFDDAAVEAANLFEFEPATENGVAIPVRITYKYRFEAPPKPMDDTSVQNSSKPEPTVSDPTTPEKVLNFSGTLIERGTRLPLPGVRVTVFRGEGEQAVGYEAIADSEGVFAFFNLDEGQWRVLAEPEGYYPLRTVESIEPNKKTTAKYYVEKSDYNPYDIIVEGKPQRKEVSKTSLSVAQIEKVPGTAGDVLQVVKNLPGVAKTGPVAGNIIIRGSSPEDSLIFINGANVPIVYHFGGLRSVVPMGMLSGIDFYPGNFSAQYGRATGGIVDVRLKKLAPQKIGGYADVNIVDAGVYLEAPIGEKAAIAVAGRRSYIDGILNAVVPGDANVNLITAPRYYDYQLLGTYRPNGKHTFTGFFFGSDDQLKLLFENPADISPDFKATDVTTSTSFYRSLLEYTFTPSDKITNVFKTAAGRNWIFFGAGDQLYLDLNNYIAQIQDKLSIQLTDAFKLNMGLDYLYTKSDARIKFPDVSKEGEPGGKPNLDEVKFTEGSGDVFHSIGSYVELEARLFNRLTLVPGMRFDYFSRVDETALAPRFNALFDINNQWTIKGGVGLYHKEPSFDETNAVFGNPDLGLESAIHYSAGFEYRPLDHMSLDITGFYKDLNHLVSRTTETNEQNGQTVPLNFVNGGEGRVFGMEVLLKHEFAHNFSGWLSYTLSKAERKDVGSNSWRPFDFDQTHILTVLGTYHLPRNWQFGFRWRLVSGNPDTPREGAVYNVDDGTYDPIYGKPNSTRLPMFHQLDIRLDKRWVFNNWMLTAYLDVQNAYNQANAVGYSYNFDSSKKKPRTSLPILPIIGIKGEF